MTIIQNLTQSNQWMSIIHVQICVTERHIDLFTIRPYVCDSCAPCCTYDTIREFI